MAEAVVMEVSNLKIDWLNEYLEIELLDTNFEGIVAKLGNKMGHKLSNVKDRDIISVELITDILDRQQKLDSKVMSYEAEILNFMNNEGIELVKEGLNLPFVRSFEYISVSNETSINYNLLERLVLNEIDIRKRIIEIKRRLLRLAMLGKIKSIDEIVASITNTTDKNFKLLAIHPSLKIAVFSCFQSYGLAYGGQGGDTYYWSGFKIQARHLNSDFSVGEVIAERIVYSDNGQGTTIPASEFEFSSLGDAAILKAWRGVDTYGIRIGYLDEIVDFSEYGLALSPNWQGITLDVLLNRV